MSKMESAATSDAAKDEGGHGGGGEGVYHVNTRQARVASRGEELTGAVILERVGLSPDKYELWTEVNGKAGVEIKPIEGHHVQPGDHFRATIRGTDYSSGSLSAGWEPAR